MTRLNRSDLTWRRLARSLGQTPLALTLALASALAVAGCGGGSVVLGDGGADARDASVDTAPTCAASEQLCSGRCVDVSADRAHCGACGTACPAGQFCVMGRCALTCPPMQTLCGERCADLQTDRANCGACGTACAAGQVCAMGRCGVECPTDQTVCADRCVDTRSDPNHCGMCGRACPETQLCRMGACATSCGALRECAGRCVDVQTDRAHCGACGTACPADQQCVTGACQTVCPAGQRVCGGRCVDVQTDRAHCGACGTACPADQQCVTGACRVVCPMGQTECMGRCVDTRVDRANCGACGTACASGQVCSMGACALECAAPLARCTTPTGPACADTRSDPRNCGTCGTACAAGLACLAGACGCPTGLTACAGACRDTRNDPANCGACGAACMAGQICNAGACVAVCPTGFALCGGRCVDARADAANCGACGRACSAGQVCRNAMCEPEVVEAGCGPMDGAAGDPLNDNVLTRFCTITGPVTVVTVAHAPRGAPVPLPLTGVPNGSRLIRAFFYRVTFDSSATFVNEWSLAGTRLTTRTRLTAQRVSPNHEVARADVTDVVAPLIPPTGGTVNMAYSHSPGDSSGGLALVAVFAHPSLPRNSVQIYDGSHTDLRRPAGEVLTLDGVVAGGAPPRAVLHLWGSGDGPMDAPCNATFSTMRSSIPLADVCEPAAGLYIGRQIVDVSRIVNAGDASARLQFDLRNDSAVPLVVYELTPR